jgi:hypothetical protein
VLGKWLCEENIGNIARKNALHKSRKLRQAHPLFFRHSLCAVFDVFNVKIPLCSTSHYAILGYLARV